MAISVLCVVGYRIPTYTMFWNDGTFGLQLENNCGYTLDDCTFTEGCVLCKQTYREKNRLDAELCRVTSSNVELFRVISSYLFE
jgi:hypothetical protein